MLLKTRKPGTFPQNYSPLPAISKIVERVVLDKLQEKTEHHQILPKQQSGFREAQIVEHNILKILKYNSLEAIPTGDKAS